MSRPRPPPAGARPAGGLVGDSRMSRSDTSWRWSGSGPRPRWPTCPGWVRGSAHPATPSHRRCRAGEARHPGHLDPWPELELVAGDRRSDRARRRVSHPVRGERRHERPAGGVELALVLAAASWCAAAARSSGAATRPPRGAPTTAARRAAPASGSGLGHRRHVGSVDRRLSSSTRRRRAAVLAADRLGAPGTATSSPRGSSRSCVGLALPPATWRSGRAHGRHADGAGAAGGDQRDAGGDETGHHDDGDQQDGRPGRADPGLAAGARRSRRGSRRRPQRAVVGREPRGSVGQLRQATDTRQARGAARRPVRPAGSWVRPTRSKSSSEAAAGGDEGMRSRTQPTKRPRARVDAGADGPEPPAPQGEAEQHAERDQPDRPQVGRAWTSRNRTASGSGRRRLASGRACRAPLWWPSRRGRR